MQRDMDLVRMILLETEQHQEPNQDVQIQAASYSPEQIAYHVKLLAQAGYIEANDYSSLGNLAWRPTSLTWDGHEFLDATRNSKIWQRLKAELKDKGATLPFTLIQQL